MYFSTSIAFKTSATYSNLREEFHDSSFLLSQKRQEVSCSMLDQVVCCRFRKLFKAETTLQLNILFFQKLQIFLYFFR